MHGCTSETQHLDLDLRIRSVVSDVERGDISPMINGSGFISDAVHNSKRAIAIR